MVDPTLLSFRAGDGYRWYYRHYPAAGRAKARIVFLHGIRSHGGWYARRCTAFAAAGYDVFFLDRRGAGLNTARRGDTPGFRRLLDDIAEFLREERRSHPALPTVLGGISWGGKLAAAFDYRHPALVDALLLFCPGLCPQVRPPLLQRVGVVRARLRNPTKPFPIPLNDPELFTASETWRGFIAADPHGLTETTARFQFSSAQLDVYLKRAAKGVTDPTLLLLAERDRVLDNDRTRAFAAGLTRAKGLTVIEYPGAEHTLEFEPPGHPFVADTLAWLGRVLA